MTNRIPTKPVGPSAGDIAQVVSGFSLYKSVHFFERKPSSHFEPGARSAERKISTWQNKGRFDRLAEQLSPMR